jgi:hypothetical protein
MTVSAERALPNNALPELLDVLPDADSYFLIFCVDKPSFKVTGLKTAPTSGRMGRLRVGGQPRRPAAPTPNLIAAHAKEAYTKTQPALLQSYPYDLSQTILSVVLPYDCL